METRPYRRKSGLKPEVEICELSKDSIKFIIHNIGCEFANAIRRVMIAEVPTMRIDVVEITKNNTVMQDDILAHRLGLCPLKSSTTEDFVYAEDCGCDSGSCEKCGVEFSLDVRTDSKRQIHVVTTQDLIKKSTKEVYPVPEDEPPITLTKLGPNQHLQLKAIARKGIGRDHTKWTPVTAAGATPMPIFKLQKEELNRLDHNSKKHLVDVCPRKVFSLSSADDAFCLDKPLECTYCNECLKHCRDILHAPKLIEITTSKNDFIFNIETDQSLSPQEVVVCAFRVLTEKLSELEQALDMNSTSTNSDSDQKREDRLEKLTTFHTR